VILPPKLRWCPVRAYIVAGRALISLVSDAGPLITVELRFNAAEATNEPAPRVEDGIIHGILGFVGELGWLGVDCEGNDSVRVSASSCNVDAKDGVDFEAVNRETVLYGELDVVSLLESEGISCCDIMDKKVFSLF